MEYPTHFWLKRTKNEKDEFPKTFEDFSIRLGELKRNKFGVVPFVGYDDPTKHNDIRWLKYSEYKKLKEESAQ